MGGESDPRERSWHDRPRRRRLPAAAQRGWRVLMGRSSVPWGACCLSWAFLSCLVAVRIGQGNNRPSLPAHVTCRREKEDASGRLWISELFRLLPEFLPEHATVSLHAPVRSGTGESG